MPNWSEVLEEIAQEQREGERRRLESFDRIRRKYLKKLSEFTGRNVIAYYSAFLSKPRYEGVEITDDDKNGFMMAIHQLDRGRGLDLILHTPGGNIAAAESLIHYLRQMFGDDIRAIVPQIAMSAGTIIACSCKEIWMGKHSNIGPIDPQINGIPAVVVKREIERAYNDVKRDPVMQIIWGPIISKYPPTFIDNCDLAIKWASDLVKKVLVENMIKNKENKEYLADLIVEKLSDVGENKAHDRHLHYEYCEEIGLNVKRLEDDSSFQDLVLTVHHCFMHALSNTNAIKIIENHEGRAIIKSIADNVPANYDGM